MCVKICPHSHRPPVAVSTGVETRNALGPCRRADAQLRAAADMVSNIPAPNNRPKTHSRPAFSQPLVVSGHRDGRRKLSSSGLSVSPSERRHNDVAVSFSMAIQIEQSATIRAECLQPQTPWPPLLAAIRFARPLRLRVLWRRCRLACATIALDRIQLNGIVASARCPDAPSAPLLLPPPSRSRTATVLAGAPTGSQFLAATIKAARVQVGELYSISLGVLGKPEQQVSSRSKPPKQPRQLRQDVQLAKIVSAGRRLPSGRSVPVPRGGLVGPITGQPERSERRHPLA